MMEWLFSVSLTDQVGSPVKANVSVKNQNSDEEARRAIIHKVLACGGSVSKIEEPEDSCENIYMEVI